MRQTSCQRVEVYPPGTRADLHPAAALLPPTSASARALAIFGPHSVSGARAAKMRRVAQTVRDRIARGPMANRRDFWHYVLGHLRTEEERSADQNDTKKGTPEMTEAEMYANAFSISIAGSEGTATALAGTVFLLLRHPAALRRAVAEVRGVFAAEADITSAAAVARLPFLSAALSEALRVYPPVAVTLPRRVPPGGEVVEGRFVPGGFTVGVNHLACYRSERNFADAA